MRGPCLPISVQCGRVDGGDDAVGVNGGGGIDDLSEYCGGDYHGQIGYNFHDVIFMMMMMTMMMMTMVMMMITTMLWANSA